MEALSETCRAAFEGASVLLTGAGGSLGAALALRLAELGLKRLFLLERSERALYDLTQRLSKYPGTEVLPVLGSVTDPRLLARLFVEGQVDIVLHTAAYKHLPILEANPLMGLENNFGGTQCLVQQAARAGVPRLLNLSTDKAVRPVSVLGASKRLAELAVADQAQRDEGRCFASLRLGNVWGSSGSVVPLFRRQIAAGGPVTVTHPLAERYFLPPDRATTLALEAAAGAGPGQVLMPDMGPPQRITAVAERLMEEAERRVPMRFIGLRPGEKLRESLTWGAAVRETDLPGLFLCDGPPPHRASVPEALRRLREARLAGCNARARALVADWCGPGEQPQPQSPARERR
jgi:FlaA1/EpsC-like NDP-sugar epimerase